MTLVLSYKLGCLSLHSLVKVLVTLRFRIRQYESLNLSLATVWFIVPCKDKQILNLFNETEDPSASDFKHGLIEDHVSCISDKGSIIISHVAHSDFAEELGPKGLEMVVSIVISKSGVFLFIGSVVTAPMGTL